MARRLDSGILGELTPVKTGDRLVKALTAKRINAIQDAIKVLAEAQLEERRNRSTVPPRILHPFQIIWLGVPQGETVKQKVEVAWGTVSPMSNSEGGVTITDLDTAFVLEDGDKVWLHVAFESDGSITSCVLKHGIPSANGWTTYPSRYEYVGSSTWNEWFHPIAEVRAARTGKASTGSNNDPGEYSVVGDLVIAQLTNTHLVVQQFCETGGGIYALVPGPGATSS